MATKLATNCNFPLIFMDIFLLLCDNLCQVIPLYQGFWGQEIICDDCKINLICLPRWPQNVIYHTFAKHSGVDPVPMPSEFLLDCYNNNNNINNKIHLFVDTQIGDPYKTINVTM